MSKQVFVYVRALANTDDVGAAGVYQWVPNEKAEFLPRTHCANAVSDAFEAAGIISAASAYEVLIVDVDGIELLLCDGVMEGIYRDYGAIRKSDHRIEKITYSKPVHGIFGGHDWLISQTGEDDKYRYQAFVDDRPVGYRGTWEGAISLALRVCLGLIHDGLGRLYDHPQGFMPKLPIVNGSYIVRQNEIGEPLIHYFRIDTDLSGLGSYIADLCEPGCQCQVFNAVRDIRRGVVFHVRPDGSLVNNLNAVYATETYPEMASFIEAIPEYELLPLRVLDDRYEVTEPARYDGVEIHGVKNLNPADGECTACEVDDEEPDFFSVYLHLKEGGIECVGDHATMELAEQYAEDLKQQFGFN